MADNQAQPEVTIESLQADLAAEQAAHQTTRDELTQVKSDLDHAGESHDGQVDALNQAAGIIEGQKETIAQLEAKNKELQLKPAEFPTITVDKTEYLVKVKSFKHDGRTYSAEELLSDKALQKSLVKLGVGFLVKKEV